MAENQYNPISWNPDDLITVEKMQADSSNLDWLRDNTPRSEYRAFSVRRTTGIKTVCGVAVIPKSRETRANVNVQFPEIFTTDCKPIITNGIIASQRRVHVTLQGLDQFFPDERGFTIKVTIDNPGGAKQNRIDKKIYIPWTAVGY